MRKWSSADAAAVTCRQTPPAPAIELAGGRSRQRSKPSLRRSPLPRRRRTPTSRTGTGRKRHRPAAVSGSRRSRPGRGKTSCDRRRAATKAAGCPPPPPPPPPPRNRRVRAVGRYRRRAPAESLILDPQTLRRCRSRRARRLLRCRRSSFSPTPVGPVPQPTYANPRRTTSGYGTPSRDRPAKPPPPPMPPPHPGRLRVAEDQDRAAGRLHARRSPQRPSRRFSIPARIGSARSRSAGAMPKRNRRAPFRGSSPRLPWSSRSSRSWSAGRICPGRTAVAGEPGATADSRGATPRHRRQRQSRQA